MRREDKSLGMIRCQCSELGWFVRPDTINWLRRGPGQSLRERQTWESESSLLLSLNIKTVDFNGLNTDYINYKDSDDFLYIYLSRWVSEKSQRKAALKELEELTRRGCEIL